MDMAEAIAGDFPGGLGIAAIVACCFFGAVSGFGPAIVAAIGAVMLPAMLTRGYDVGYSGGLLACAGGIGVLIPPSVPMIIYGVNSGASITDLFVAGIGPGILVGLCLMIPTYTIARRKGYTGKPRGSDGKSAISLLLRPRRESGLVMTAKTFAAKKQGCAGNAKFFFAPLA